MAKLLSEDQPPLPKSDPRIDPLNTPPLLKDPQELMDPDTARVLKEADEERKAQKRERSPLTKKGEHDQIKTDNNSTKYLTIKSGPLLPPPESKKDNVIPRNQLPGYKVIHTWFGDAEKWDPLPKDFGGIIGPSLIGKKPEQSAASANAGIQQPIDRKADLSSSSSSHTAAPVTKQAPAKTPTAVQHDKFSDLQDVKDDMAKLATTHNDKERAAILRQAATSINHAGYTVQGREAPVNKHFDYKKLSTDVAGEIDALAKALKAHDTKGVKAHSDALSRDMFQGVRNTVEREQEKSHR